MQFNKNLETVESRMRNENQNYHITRTNTSMWLAIFIFKTLIPGTLMNIDELVLIQHMKNFAINYENLFTISTIAFNFHG